VTARVVADLSEYAIPVVLISLAALVYLGGLLLMWSESRRMRRDADHRNLMRRLRAPSVQGPRSGEQLGLQTRAREDRHLGGLLHPTRRAP
jgi:hypothetical protein